MLLFFSKKTEIKSNIKKCKININMVEISEIIEEKTNEFDKEDEVNEEKQKPINNGGYSDKYSWSQTAYDLSVNVPIKKEIIKKDIFVEIKTKRIIVKFEGDIYINGELQYDVKSETSTWYLEKNNNKNTLIIEFDKLKKQEWWSYLIKGDKEIDMSLIRPAQEQVSDLDQETRYTIDKMLYDQKIKEQNNPDLYNIK
jgi:hypothetical protein